MEQILRVLDELNKKSMWQIYKRNQITEYTN